MNPASPLTVTRSCPCPALLRIVAARDGGLCRIKLPGGELSAEQALAIADAADRHASGIVEFTNRANLQLRGVLGGKEAACAERLLRAGLGPQLSAPAFAAAGGEHASLERIAAADDIRNVMISPAAGRDPQAICDTRPLAAQLLALLQGEPRFAALSPKFALLLDGGERLAMLDHPHDIWLSAADIDVPGAWFAFGLASRPGTDTGGTLGMVPASGVLPLVEALLHTFINLARSDDSRMRHLLERCGAEAIVRDAATRMTHPLRLGTQLPVWHRRPVQPERRFGAHRQPQPGLWYVGAQPTLERTQTAALRRLAQLAQRYGCGTLRMTPWQGVLLPDIEEASVAPVETEFDALGFVRDAAHPLARLVACAGSTGCGRSAADTKADALALARRLPGRVQVHLSGCVRSCAAAHSAEYTLLAVAPQRYDLYLGGGGRAPMSAEAGQTASDAADASDAVQAVEATEATRRFGRRVSTFLTIDEAAEALGALPRSPTHA